MALLRFDRRGFWVAVFVAFVGYWIWGPAIAQDPAYYDFADKRTWWGIPNFWNVVSNAAFVVVGLVGLYIDKPGGDVQLRWCYRLFFIGVVLTGFGSGYFHWRPDHYTLIADRLPMAIAFMALTSALLGESYYAELGQRLLWPLQLLGAASVLWWGYSEHIGAGDLRLYVVVQFVPMVALPLVIWRRRSRFLPLKYVWGTILLYGMAKVVELLDQQVFALGGWISGHGLKHFVAASACAAFARGLQKRHQEAGHADI